MAPNTWLEKADSFLAAAQLMMTSGHYESAVSRAYYAARHAAIHLFLSRNAKGATGWLHETMASKIIEQGRRVHWLRTAVMAGQQEFSKSWLLLLKHRNQADYALGEIDARIAERCLKFAEAFIYVIKENVL